MLTYFEHNIIVEILSLSWIAYQAIKVIVNRVKERKEFERMMAEARETVANIKWEC